MTVDATARRPLRHRVPLGPYGPLGLLIDPMTWRAVPYLLVAGFATGTAWFVILAVGLSTALALVIVWAGLPLLLLAMLLWRGGAMLERRVLRLAFGVVIPDPYRPRPESGLVRHLGWLIGDPATWKDLGYLLLLFPLGLSEFLVSLTLWSCAIGLLAQPVVVLSGDITVISDGLVIDSLPGSLPWALCGVAALVVTLYVTRGMAWLHGLLAVALLGPGDEARVRHLRASRARGVDAAEAERRRIERDLHDGAQQRLLSVAMELGRAQAKFDSAPEEARELLARAHADAKAAIAELRDLARGIYPAILTDRGLDAALSALAARAPNRVDVVVELDERPPAAVESIAYFIVAESLANVAKHSVATEASVLVGREGHRVVVEVRDNGIGGAEAVPGGGLAGLADRAATIDGTLTIESPPGGPTVVRARLPYEW
ncbi:histidine kinase [Sphaerisporangium siamense]|uniref:histidine kinase n=1 Tax=Sphaerisporangium siamense TaxID=795645 RepID=A0A7W7GDJ7_9ACTN|nr:sensor histidine kinase [Sphaerisporangium siamense]MBB4705667.1 signal transduction histidine kinase [Sphaerisporangium siamense]GII82949.1 histidine kinase [Sphaerisporangium siamense]